MIGEASALAAAASWAVGSHFFGRIGKRSGASPGALNLGKCLTGAALFALTALALRGSVMPVASRTAIGWLSVSGVVGLSLGDSSYFHAIKELGVRRAILLLSTAPMFTAIGGAAFLGEALKLHDIGAIILVMVGVTIVVLEQRAVKAEVAPEKPSMRGILFGFGAGIGQAVGSLMSRHAMKEGVPPLDASVIRLTAGLLGIVVLSALAGRLRGEVATLKQGRLLASIAAAATIGTYGGIWLSQIAISHASSTAVATTLLATSPLFALPLGRVLEREPITLRAIAGTLTAMAGVALFNVGAA